MRWTKKHSQNAVAARARLRMERAVVEPMFEKPSHVFKPRRPKPDFILRLEDRFGERLQISIHRHHGRLLISGGITSARQLCRGIEHLLTKSA